MLVRESLYNFKRETDPIISSKLGKIKLIEDWLKDHKKGFDLWNAEYKINDDLTIDIYGSVFFKGEYGFQNKLPEYIQFNIAHNNFIAMHSNLESLKGFPKYVKGTFNCSNNKLTSLKYCPKIIGVTFACSNNQLTSLEGCPDNVGFEFYCSGNLLTSLEGCPKSVGSNFYCYNNKKKFTKEYVRSLCDVKGNKITC